MNLGESASPSVLIQVTKNTITKLNELRMQLGRTAQDFSKELDALKEAKDAPTKKKNRLEKERNLRKQEKQKYLQATKRFQVQTNQLEAMRTTQDNMQKKSVTAIYSDDPHSLTIFPDYQYHNFPRNHET